MVNFEKNNLGARAWEQRSRQRQSKGKQKFQSIFAGTKIIKEPGLGYRGLWNGCQGANKSFSPFRPQK